jgi:hypothetical protein
MKTFIKLAMVALSISTIGCKNENLDSRAIGNQLIEVDKVLAVWEGHQARSVHAVKNFVKDDMFLSSFDGSSGFKTLQYQNNLLQKINGLEKEIRDQSLMDWCNVQTEALNLLRSSRGESPEKILFNPLEILSKQERELKLIYDKRKKLVDTLVQHSKG